MKKKFLNKYFRYNLKNWKHFETKHKPKQGITLSMSFFEDFVFTFLRDLTSKITRSGFYRIEFVLSTAELSKLEIFNEHQSKNS